MDGKPSLSPGVLLSLSLDFGPIWVINVLSRKGLAKLVGTPKPGIELPRASPQSRDYLPRAVPTLVLTCFFHKQLKCQELAFGQVYRSAESDPFPRTNDTRRVYIYLYIPQ